MDLVIKNQTDYSKLFHILINGDAQEPINIYLTINFLIPMDVLILTEFIICCLSKDLEVNLIVNSSSVKDYLAAIGIFEFCTKNYREPREIEEISSFTAMPLRRVDRETMNYYITKTQGYFQSFCQGKDLGMLNITISELVNNVYDHSKSPIDSYVFSQFYPTLGIIKIAVADLGDGIAATVNNFFEKKGLERVSEEEAVKWSLRLNSTTQSMPHNAGRGLDTINSFVESNGGSWKLFTNHVKMEGAGGICNFSSSPIVNFIGTVIEISINVNNLEDLETVDILDW